ncbi:MAG: hypothetical protein HC828_08720 [Blastochloris sp.]|nr:hypothetical protein [Blastochloris sp.]
MLVIHCNGKSMKLIIPPIKPIPRASMSCTHPPLTDEEFAKIKTQILTIQDDSIRISMKRLAKEIERLKHVG